MLIALVTLAAFVLVLLLAALVILTPFYLAAEWTDYRARTFFPKEYRTGSVSEPLARRVKSSGRGQS